MESSLLADRIRSASLSPFRSRIQLLLLLLLIGMLDVLPELGVGQRPVHQAGDQLSAYGDGLVALGLDGLVPELLGVQSVEGVGNGQLGLCGSRPGH